VLDFAVIFAPGIHNPIIRLRLILRCPTIVSHFDSGYLMTLVLVTTLASLPVRLAVFFYLFFIILSGVRLSPLGTAATTGLLYQPQMIDDGDCGEIGGMKIGRGNRSTRSKHAPAPLCPPQIPALLCYCVLVYLVLHLPNSACSQPVRREGVPEAMIRKEFLINTVKAALFMYVQMSLP
jgi:hypothetical protein